MTLTAGFLDELADCLVACARAVESSLGHSNPIVGAPTWTGPAADATFAAVRACGRDVAEAALALVVEAQRLQVLAAQRRALERDAFAAADRRGRC